jgi:hypothetical protein
MFTKRKIPIVASLSSVIAIVVAASALATGTTVTTGSGQPIVYQTAHMGTSTTLGPQSNPTHLGDTPALAAGTYLVQYSVGLVMGPNDNVVCAASSTLNGNDGVFGTAGNGATESGTGPNGIYGQAAALDTIRVSKGQTIGLTCNVGHFGQGTYAGDWTLTATKIGTLHKQTL